MELWDILKTLSSWIIMPLIGGLMYFVRKSFNRLEKMEEEVQEQKIKTAVIESKVDDIRDDIKEIKYNVERLVDRK